MNCIRTWIISTLFVLASYPLVYGQIAADETLYLPNEILVMLDEAVDEDKVWSQLRESMAFQIVSVPSPSARIYQIEVAEEDWNGALGKFAGHPHVRAAQLNHEVSERSTVPNDPNYGQQWHHEQSGDHDIDSDLAWDITTGGNAGNGARVVVAVLEGGGSNYSHTDLVDNHWVNEGETPDNGVDDDGNGYVDDYNGWNSGNNSDNISAGGHGTSVSGMIGATGDNGIGGVGVNWDVDIMQIDMPNGLSEANVVASYEYPKVMRDMFNESGGEEGAFVVATNASWGIDQANPANYPVWCAYYDELGASGILNCGATVNSSINVDVVGDMPTACSSDYMVSVTATNSSDVRTFSGYGVTTIDLGAPGEQVYLPNGSSSYGNTSGTSFASPCVAGAIALVYSVPCPDLADLAISNPQGAADLVFGYIMEGTDEVSNLIAETVSGGRLNVANSVNLALAGCGPVECNIEAFEAESFCSFNTETGGIETVVELTAEYSNFLCAADVLCYRDTAELTWNCNLTDNMDFDLSDGSTGTMYDLNPNTSYEMYFLVDTLSSDTISFTTPDCLILIPGCTSETALNFDPEATIDDGSCEFPCVDMTFTLTTDCWPEEVGWSIVDESGNVTVEIEQETYEGEETVEVWTGCVTYGCHTLSVTDSYGDGMFGSQWPSCTVDGNYVLTTSDSLVVIAMGDPDYGGGIEHEFCVPVVTGCTEEGACNYDEAANVNDGSCFAIGDACEDGDEGTILDVVGVDCECAGVLPVEGCTDSDACNYDAAANLDDGSCFSIGDGCDDNDEGTVLDAIGLDCECAGVLPVNGCLDLEACNYNELANVEDGSCTYVAQGDLVGESDVIAGTLETYTYDGPMEHMYDWSALGGVIQGPSSGTGLLSVDVLWDLDESQSANVTVTETDVAGCSGDVVVVIDLLINDLSELTRIGLEIFPNPVTDYFQWRADPSALGATLNVYDVNGRLVHSVRIQHAVQIVDCQHLEAGLYTVRLFQEGLAGITAGAQFVIAR